MPTRSQSPFQNRLLNALSPPDFASLRPHLEAVDLPLRTALIETDETISHVHFLESGLASIIAMSPDDEKIEVGNLGWEGMSGTCLVLGVDRTPNRTFMQVGGHGLRLEAGILKEALDASPALRVLLLRYVHTYEIQITHSALANARYTMKERLARWLLMSHDRLSGDDLPLTHELLSLMLGVRRSSVTNEIHVLEGVGIIKARRSHIQVLDRARLEEIAGGCYGLPEREYDRLIGVSLQSLAETAPLPDDPSRPMAPAAI